MSEQRNAINNLISSDFSISGAWGPNPNKINDKKYIHFGNLKVSDGNGYLYLFEMNKDKTLFRYNELYGHTFNNEFINLYNVWGSPFSKNGVINLNDNTSLTKEKLISNFLTISNYDFSYIKKDTILTIEISGLNLWLPRMLKPEEYDGHNDKKNVGILYKEDNHPEKEIGKFYFKHKCYQLFLNGRIISSQKDFKEKSFRNLTWLEIRQDQGISERDGAMIACSIERLFILLFGLNLRLTHLYLHNSDRNQSISLFPLYDYPVLKPSYSYKDFLLCLCPYESIKDDLKDVVKSWFSKNSSLTNLVNNFNQTIMFNYTTQMKFITLTQGIESYFNNRNMPFREELYTFISRLPIRYKDLLNQSLQKRFKNLNNWISDIVDTRVFYTHGNYGRKHILNNFLDQIITVKLLQIIIQTFSLQILGYLPKLDRFKDKIDKAMRTEIIEYNP